MTRMQLQLIHLFYHHYHLTFITTYHSGHFHHGIEHLSPPSLPPSQSFIFNIQPYLSQFIVCANKSKVCIPQLLSIKITRLSRKSTKTRCMAIAKTICKYPPGHVFLSTAVMNCMSHMPCSITDHTNISS